MQRNWTITRFRDYVKTPKADGYRALHLVDRNQGRLIEIQLRTPRQDEWANAVEGAEQRFPGLKAGGGPTSLREFLVATAEVYAMLDGNVELSPPQVLELRERMAKGATFTKEQFDEP